MNMRLKLVKIGDSTGVILPKELLAQLRVGLGDCIYATETANGVRLSASSRDAKMALAEAVMREDGAILRDLAK